MEAVISRNGPTLAHADSLIEAALDMYFKEKTSNGKWHFKSASGSALNNAGKVMVRHTTEKSKLKFMNGNKEKSHNQIPGRCSVKPKRAWPLGQTYLAP